MSEQLAIIPRETALTVLTDAEQFDAFYARVKAEVDAHVPDLTTDKGRKAIASLAYKVSQTKSAIDEAGKLLTEEWRTQTKRVDESRRRIRDQLDSLRDLARQPLTEWEEAEKRREKEAADLMAQLQLCAVVHAEWTSDDIHARLRGVQSIYLDADVLREAMEMATNLKERAEQTLGAALNRAIQQEVDARELAALKAAEEERQAKAAAEQAAREAEEVARAAEEEKRAAAAREEEARQTALREAAEEAARETERRAKEALEAAEAAHQAELAAIKRKAQEEQAERDREAAIQADADRAAQAERDRLAAEDRRRQNDRAHKVKVMGEAKAALMSLSVGGLSISEESAIMIVRAIVAGEIPHTKVVF